MTASQQGQRRVGTGNESRVGARETAGDEAQLGRFRADFVSSRIDQPISGERWVGARGAATTLNGAPITTRPCPSLADAHLATTGPGYFTPESWSAFERARQAAEHALRALRRRRQPARAGGRQTRQGR